MEAEGEPHDPVYKKCCEVCAALREKTTCDVAAIANAHSHNSPHLFACECILCDAANTLIATIVAQRRSELAAFQLVSSVGNIFPLNPSPVMPALLLSVRPARSGRGWERVSPAMQTGNKGDAPWRCASAKKEDASLRPDELESETRRSKGVEEKKGTPSPFCKERLLLRDDVAALKDLYRLPDDFESG
jgi:hypothetical protein